MFFIGIFGVEMKEKEIKDIQNKICKICGSMTALRLFKTYSYFHIFFIPLFKWNIKYYVISRCCNTMFEIPEEIGKALEGGRDIPLSDEDMRPVYPDGRDNYVICPECRRPIDNNFSYCPYCGARLK